MLATAAGHVAISLGILVFAAVVYFVLPWWGRVVQSVYVVFGLSTKRIPVLTRFLQVACAAFFIVGVVSLVVALIQAA